MCSSSRSRLTYCSSDSPRAPGRAPLSASAAWTMTASTVWGSTSLWWASIAWATASGSPCRRTRSPPTSACGPSISWETALPMSCSSAERRGGVWPRARPPRRAAGGLRARAELVGHHRGELRALDRVGEDVLAVRRAEAQPAEQLGELGIEAVHVGLEHRGLAELDDVALELGLRLVVGLLDPRRVDTPVLEQLLERHPGDLPADAVEGGEHDRVGRVVDDEVDPGEVLERADVAALAADDAALHVVGRQLDDRHCGLRGVARRQALHRDREDR